MRVSTVSSIALIAQRQFIEANFGLPPLHFYAPDQIIDAIEDETLDAFAAQGTPFTTLVDCDIVSFAGMQLHSLPRGDHRVFCTRLPL